MYLNKNLNKQDTSYKEEEEEKNTYVSITNVSIFMFCSSSGQVKSGIQ